MTVCQSQQKCLLPEKALLFKNLISFTAHGPNPDLCSKQVILEPNGPHLQGRSWTFQHGALQHFWVLVPSPQQGRSSSPDLHLLCISEGASSPFLACQQRGPPNYPKPWYPGSPWPFHINSGATYQPFSPWIPFPSLFSTELLCPVATTHLERWTRAWLCAAVMVYL